MEITTIADEIRNTNDLEGYLNRTLEKIRANERHLVEERFFDLSLDLLCIADLNGYFTKVSKSFTTLLGYSEDELLSRPFKDFVVEDDKNNTDTAYDELKEGANLYDFENRYRCADGSIKWLAWRSVPVPGEELIFGIARDVTEHKESEARKKLYTEQLEYLVKQKNESLRYALSLQNALIQGDQLIAAQVLHKQFPKPIQGEHVKEDVENISKAVGKSIREDRPRAGNKIGKHWRDRKLIVDDLKIIFKTTHPGEHEQHAQNQKHRHVDDDQLDVAIVGPAECAFKFF